MYVNPTVLTNNYFFSHGARLASRLLHSSKIKNKPLQ